MKNLLLNRRSSDRICKVATTVFALTLGLTGIATSAFGQSACPQPAPAPATDPLQTIIPVHFDVSTGNITVGSTTYCGQNPGFHLLALQRQPDSNHLDAPDMVWDQTYTDAASVNSALQQILNTSGGPLILINGVGSYGIPLSALAQSLASFGSYSGLEVVNSAVPFIFIGSGGRKPQTALQRGYSTNPLDGYLAQDSNGNYTFTQMDFVRYDVTTDGSITVGNTKYTVAGSYKPLCNGDASNSFHLVVVDRESLQVQNIDNTYCTAQSDGEIARLVADISAHLVGSHSNEGLLVFIASNGHPIPANWNFGTDGDARIYPLAQQIAQLGGYWETMVYLTPNDTYSLVGATPPPAGTPNPRQRARESSSVYPLNVNGQAPTGELHGVLARGRGNWYSPLNADPSGSANLGLYEILAQAPVAFPHPSTPDEIDAFWALNLSMCNFVSNNNPKLCPTGTYINIRNEYANLNIHWDTYTNALTNALANYNCKNPSNADQAYCVVGAQLQSEFTEVDNIQGFYGNVNGLWSASGSVSLASQLGAYNDVKATLPAPPSAPAPSLVSPLVNLFLGVASRIPAVAPIFGLADVFFNFGTALTTDPQGNKQIDLTSTIGQLETQAANQFIAQATTTGTLFEFILQDWGKINTLGPNVAVTPDASGPWYWSPTDTPQILQAMKPAVQQAAYQNIMPAAYAIGSYYPDSGTAQGWGWGLLPLTGQPYAYVVVVDERAPYTPVSHPFWTPAYSVYSNPTDFKTSGFANQPGTGTILADGAWLAISAINTPEIGTSENFQYQPPSQTLLANLFEPVSQGLGVYRPAFFEDWPFPRLACTTAFGDRNGYSYPGGCNWSAATPVTGPVPPGPSVTSITMQAAQIASNGTEVDVRLTIFNNGTTTANSIDLTSISLRTLAGSGQATILSPTVPMPVSRLVPGDSADVTLKLNVPPSITKLSLTEAGTVDVGQSQPVQLSQGQALYPQR